MAVTQSLGVPADRAVADVVLDGQRAGPQDALPLAEIARVGAHVRPACWVGARTFNMGLSKTFATSMKGFEMYGSSTSPAVHVSAPRSFASHVEPEACAWSSGLSTAWP